MDEDEEWRQLLFLEIDRFYNWPIAWVHCPVCGASIRIVVAHLNDSHKWSFMQIANWLDNGGQKFNLDLLELAK